MTTKQASAKRIDFLAGVLVTAVEGGGIGYWASIRNYRWNEDAEHNLTSASVEVRNDEEDAVTIGGAVTKWHKITLDTVSRGIAAIKSGKITLRHDLLGTILLADAENDAGEIDSEAADCIVQAALFGELVYS